MKKSNGIIKLVIFIVVFGVIAGFGYYYFFMREDSNGGGLFPSLSTGKVNDVKNGIYSIETKTDRTKNFFGSCVVDSVDDYLVVINDTYMAYHGNCLNMVFVESGKTEKLKFEKANDSKYKVTLNGKTYNKDDKKTSIIVQNNVTAGLKGGTYDNIKYIVDYSEYPNHYYSFNGSLSSSIGYSFNYLYENNTFKFEIYNNNIKYEKVLTSYNSLPYFTTLNGYLIIIENNKEGKNYKEDMYMYSDSAQTFNSNNIMPININGVVIDSSWNRLIKYDSSTKKVYVLFSKSSNICDFKNGPYYEFVMTYNYKKLGFNTPDLNKKGSNAKDCDYAKKYYLKES